MNDLETIAITVDQVKNKNVKEIVDWLHRHNLKCDVNPLYKHNLYDDELFLHKEWCLLACFGDQQACNDVSILFHVIGTKNDLILFKTTWW